MVAVRPWFACGPCSLCCCAPHALCSRRTCAPCPVPMSLGWVASDGGPCLSLPRVWHGGPPQSKPKIGINKSDAKKNMVQKHLENSCVHGCIPACAIACMSMPESLCMCEEVCVCVLMSTNMCFWEEQKRDSNCKQNVSQIINRWTGKHYPAQNINSLAGPVQQYLLYVILLTKKRACR